MKKQILKQETKRKTLTKIVRNAVAIQLSVLVFMVTGCGDDTGTGSVTVQLTAEDVIVDGLAADGAAGDITDGWAVDFDKYITTVGDVDMHLATDDSIEAELGDVFVVDLTEVPTSGLPLWSREDLAGGRWEFNYATPIATSDSIRHSSVSEADYDTAVEQGWTYLIEGTLDKADGQSCPPAALLVAGSKVANGNTSGGNDCYDATTIRFSFGAKADTQFGPCEIDDLPGFAISEDSQQTVAIAIHGDHLFFNGFPEGDEGGVSRLAQWLADCDLNLDGEVTKEELEAIAPAQLVEIDDRFQLGGSPISPLNTMYDYVRAQLKTQGHFQGEGECAIDGVEHDHGDDEDHDDE